mgnify:CR=1 FL=1
MKVLKKLEMLVQDEKCKVVVISVDGKNELDKKEFSDFDKNWKEVKEESLSNGNPEEGPNSAMMTVFEVKA